jgi:LacI family transcriptional regulator
MTARYVRPGLTTVRQPVRELGAMAADRLHELVTGASPHDELQVLSTQLVLRASCGCPPAAPGSPTAPSTCDPHTV